MEIIEKAREFQKTTEFWIEFRVFCFIEYPKTFDCADHNKLKNS